MKMSRNTISVSGGAVSAVNDGCCSTSGGDTQMTKIVSLDRRHFIGGSDARIIMGKDEKALLRLWREKKGEAAAFDLSDVLIVQLGLVTEDLNRRWYELNTGYRIGDVQRHAIHRTIPLDGSHSGRAGQGNWCGV
jgi:hypothetical protein